MIWSRKNILKIGCIVLFVVFLLNVHPKHEQIGPFVRVVLYRDNLEIWVEDITNLFASSVDFWFDPDILIVNKLETGNLFKDCGKPWMEPVKKIDSDKGIAEFAISLIGDTQPIEGTGILLRIYFSLFSDKMPELYFYDHTGVNIVDTDDLSIIIKLVSDNIQYIPYNHILHTAD